MVLPRSSERELVLNLSGEYNTEAARCDRLRRWREKRKNLLTKEIIRYPNRVAATLKKKRLRGKFMSTPKPKKKRNRRKRKRKRRESLSSSSSDSGSTTSSSDVEILAAADALLIHSVSPTFDAN